MNKKLLCCFVLQLTSLVYAEVFYLPDSVFLGKGFEESDLPKRRSSAPYISGDTFRAFCDHVFDETKTYIDVDAIKPGDTVFLVIEMLEYFFDEVIQHIKNPFVLVTHNGDKDLPGEFAAHLDDEKIIAWFTVNLDRVHPKAYPLPIGVANWYWPHGNVDAIRQQSALQVEKTILLCASYARPSHVSRQIVYDHFRTASYCYFADEKPYDQYLLDLRKSKFVLSPRGAGMDCHRTWEALLMGAYPIVPSTPVDSVYEDLPVVIIDGSDWTVLTLDFLEKKLPELNKKTFKLEKLYADYWFDLIRSTARKGCESIIQQES